jgi:hypothetical protein
VNAAGRCQVNPDPTVEDADPGQRQAQGLRRAQQHIGPDFEFIEIANHGTAAVSLEGVRGFDDGCV